MTNDADVAKRLDTLAYPGMTANFDSARSASIAMTMLDWQVYGREYAAEMVRTSKAFAEALVRKACQCLRVTGYHDLASVRN